MGETLVWDAEGSLESVTEQGKTTSFIYTPDGVRLLRKDPAGTTLYLAGQELRLATGTNTPTVTRYYSHGGQTIALRQGAGAMVWLAGDHQGTAQVAINTETLVVNRRRQLPFGAPRGETGPWPGERGFVGGTMDASTGLTHLGAREYDPGIGRFISDDPVADSQDPQQLHGYGYANNSPITFADPTGLAPCTGPDGIGCGHKTSKEGFADQGDLKNRVTYNAYRKRWSDNAKKAQNRWESTLRNGNGVRCPDGAKRCKPSAGAAAAQARYQRDVKRSEALRYEMKRHLPKQTMPLIIGDFDGVDWARFESGSICVEAGVGAVVHGTVTGCVNWDAVGITVSGSAKIGLVAGGGAHVSAIVRINDAAADKVDSGVDFTGELGPKVIAGAGGGLKVVAERSLIDSGRNTSFEFEMGGGLHASLGGAYISGGVNTGYVEKWPS